MGKQPQSRKQRFTNRHKTRRMKVRNYRSINGKDVDEVQDIKEQLPGGKAAPDLPIDEDLPGLGQFHCLECG